MTKMMMTAGGYAPLPRNKNEPRHPVSDLATRLFDAIGAWNDRAEQRRLLSAASDLTLHDIGISRVDAEGEVEKPFWRK